VRPKLTIRDIFGYLVAYMCWLSTAAAGMLAVLQAHNTLNVLWPLGGTQFEWRMLLRPVRNFGLLLAGLVWLVYVIFCEQHYRNAITLIRERRQKKLMDPSSVPVLAPPQGWFMKVLARLGLDVLAMRFLPTLMLPLVIFVITYLLQQLGWELIQRSY
jgi:hypothetical protein